MTTSEVVDNSNTQLLRLLPCLSILNIKHISIIYFWDTLCANVTINELIIYR